MQSVASLIDVNTDEYSLKQAEKIIFDKIADLLSDSLRNANALMFVTLHQRIDKFRTYSRMYKKGKKPLPTFFKHKVEDVFEFDFFLSGICDYENYPQGEERFRCKANVIEIVKICQLMLQYKEYLRYSSDVEHLHKIVKIINNHLMLNERFVVQGSEIFYNGSGKEIEEYTQKLACDKLEEYKRNFRNINATYQEKMNAITNIYRVYLTRDAISKLSEISYVKDLVKNFCDFCQKPEVYGNLHSGEGGKMTIEATEDELEIMFNFALSLVCLAKDRGLLLK